MAAARICIRADASRIIGTGHIRRCLSLAEALRERGADILFLVRDLDVDMAPDIEAAGHTVRTLPPPNGPLSLDAEAPPHADWAAVGWEQDVNDTLAAIGDAPSWTVVDHYAFDARWHRRIRSETGGRVAAIDDVADRALEADLIVDHNWSDDHARKYAGVNRLAAPVLGGPSYALIGPAFSHVTPVPIRERVESIGIFTGGADQANASSVALDALDRLGFAGEVELVTTSFNPRLAALRERVAARPSTRLSVDLPDLAGFFGRHDLQIGAGGGATWERCRLGVPTVSLIVAANQEPVARALAERGYLSAIERADIAPDRVAGEIARLIDDLDLRRRYAERSRTLVDGRGGARVADELLK